MKFTPTNNLLCENSVEINKDNILAKFYNSIINKIRNLSIEYNTFDNEVNSVYGTGNVMKDVVYKVNCFIKCKSKCCSGEYFSNIKCLQNELCNKKIKKVRKYILNIILTVYFSLAAFTGIILFIIYFFFSRKYYENKQSLKNAFSAFLFSQAIFLIIPIIILFIISKCKNKKIIEILGGDFKRYKNIFYITETREDKKFIEEKSKTEHIKKINKNKEENEKYNESEPNKDNDIIFNEDSPKLGGNRENKLDSESYFSHCKKNEKIVKKYDKLSSNDNYLIIEMHNNINDNHIGNFENSFQNINLEKNENHSAYFNEINNKINMNSNEKILYLLKDDIGIKNYQPKKVSINTNELSINEVKLETKY